MSSVLPARRALRANRVAPNKDIENANARPTTRNTSRAKPLTSTLSNLNHGVAAGAKATALSLDKDDPTAGKRKREAFTEVTSLVTNNNVAKPGKLKGKEKDDLKKFEGVVITKTKTAVSRKPLRNVSSQPNNLVQTTVSSTSVLESVVEQVVTTELEDDNAMIVDPPVHSIVPAASTRELSMKRDSRKVPRTSNGSQHSSRPMHRVQDDDDPEANRVFKKRRTSSEAPEDIPLTSQAREQLERDALIRRINVELDNYVEPPEADPDGSEWDDLDQEDSEDPLMVSEYVTEVFDYFREIEIQTMPNPNYMANQTELGWNMRGILSDWLVQLHTTFRLLPETLFLTINILDRFLSARVVSLAKLQLVGITSMFIACKVEEVISPSVEDFAERASGTYTKDEIMIAERYILRTLDWNLSYPNPMQFLRRISKADEYNVTVRTLAKYFTEISCLEWRLIAAPPSLLSAAAMWLARMMLGKTTWTPNLAHYSSYAESSLIPTANLMINYILKPMRHEAFFKKYAHKRYYKASTYSRAWCLQHWQENTQVSLKEDLPELKRAIRARVIEDRILAEMQLQTTKEEEAQDVSSRSIFGVRNLGNTSKMS